MKTSLDDGNVITFSNFRLAPAVADQPVVQMFNWRIIRFDDRSVLVGFLENGYTCRMTSGIEFIDIARRCITTESGRRYELQGPPAHKLEDRVTIGARLALSAPGAYEDDSDAVWASMCQAPA